MQVWSNRLQDFLKQNRAVYTLIPHAPTFSSQVTAATIHVPGTEVAKTVVLEGESTSYLGVLPASRYVDLDRFGRIVGEPVRLATEERIRDLFPDCELGAIPPFGRLYGVQTYVDESLTGKREIVFAAGDHSDSIRMNYREFERLSQAEVGSFATAEGRQPPRATAA